MLADLLELAEMPAGGSVLSGFSRLTRLADGDRAPSSDANIIENTTFDDATDAFCACGRRPADCDGSRRRCHAEHDDGAGLDTAEGIDADLDDWNEGA